MNRYQRWAVINAVRIAVATPSDGPAGTAAHAAAILSWCEHAQTPDDLALRVQAVTQHAAGFVATSRSVRDRARGNPWVFLLGVRALYDCANPWGPPQPAPPSRRDRCWHALRRCFQ